MKTNRFNPIPPPRQGETIARFGQAQLVRQPDGRHELMGGTAADHGDARDWCSFFAPEVVFSCARQTRPACAFAA